jgi:hypothetical protein
MQLFFCFSSLLILKGYIHLLSYVNVFGLWFVKSSDISNIYFLNIGRSNWYAFMVKSYLLLPLARH